MLVFSRRIGTSFFIGDDVEVVVLDIDHGKVKLGIKADRSIPVHRDEVQQRILAQRAAANGKHAPHDSGVAEWDDPVCGGEAGTA